MTNKISELINKEEERQKNTLMMIPSENYTYPEVRSAVGSVLMHKYAEGQPKKRYYQGQSVVDEIELYCQEMALKAFGLDAKVWGVNVQPHSGCPANLAVYNALLEINDPIMSMFLPDGGHLSHGWEIEGNKITLVSKIYKVNFYHVDSSSQVFDYDQIEKQALKVKPKLLISGGTAYPREVDHQKMAKIAKKVGAYYMTDVSHEAGLIAGGANSSPFPFADVVTMTTHKTLRGPRGAMIFAKKELIEEINRSIFPGIQGGPHLHSIAGIAISLEKSLSADFKQYAKQTVKNARFIAETLIKNGFNVVSGGTDKHLVLLDLRNKKVNGWYAAWALEKSGIILNRNTVPNDTSTPYYPSGIRLGTPAVTVRGMKEVEMEKICDMIISVISHLGVKEIPQDTEIRDIYLKKFKNDIEKDGFYKTVASEVVKLCNKFPIPQ